MIGLVQVFFHYAYTTLDYYELSFVYFWGIAIWNYLFGQLSFPS